MRLYELEQEAMLEKISRENYIKTTAAEEGLQQGIQQGIQQNIKEVALNMNKNNIAKEDICQILNISKEELKIILDEK